MWGKDEKIGSRLNTKNDHMTYFLQWAFISAIQVIAAGWKNTGLFYNSRSISISTKIMQNWNMAIKKIVMEIARC